MVVAKTATGGMEGVRKFWILDFGFWVNFRLEDRICRKEVKKNLKLETGKVKGERWWSSFALCGSGVMQWLVAG